MDAMQDHNVKTQSNQSNRWLMKWMAFFLVQAVPQIMRFVFVILATNSVKQSIINKCTINNQI